MKSANDHVVAFMDMGTNSVRLMIVRIGPDNTYSIISRQKEMIRIGEREFHDGLIREDSIDRAVELCKNFMEMARSFHADEIIAVATSAARDAGNRKDFVSRLKSEAGLDVRIVSGTEEARLIYLGVSRGTHVPGKSLFIDIGGGSTELIVGDEKGYQYLDSLKLGAIRLTMLHLDYHDGPVLPEQYHTIQDYIRSKSIRSIQRLRDLDIRQAYGSSGTVQNLAEIACQTFHKGNPEKRMLMSIKDLKQVVELLCSLPLSERRKVPGIKASRADIIVGGAVILDTILTDLKISEIRISNRELRDGLLVDYLCRNDRPLMDESSVRQSNILKLGRRCGFDEAHARNVARLSLELFDSAKTLGLHDQGKRERELLTYAAQLHDIGTFLSYSSHHANSAYFIRNADILGFSQEELAVIATTAFFHRKGLPDRYFHEFSALSESDQNTVMGQFLFLRIAESLDRSHAGLVESARFRKDGDGGAVLEIRSSKDCRLEVWGVQDHCETFRKIYNRDLTILTA